jgi:pimeloyl-ACP methyl ester carboxylesterase
MNSKAEEISFLLPPNSFHIAAKIYSNSPSLINEYVAKYPSRNQKRNPFNSNSMNFDVHNQENEIIFLDDSKRISEEYLPILVLHGWLDNASSFDLLIPCILSKITNKPVLFIAFDLPGHGYSDHSDRYTLNSFIFWTKEILMFLDWKKCGFMGHSMGSNVATFFCSIFPESCLFNIMIDNFGPITFPYSVLPKISKRYVKLLKAFPFKALPRYETFEEACNARQKGTSEGTISMKGANALTLRGLQHLNDNTYTWKTDPKLMIFNPESYSEGQVLYMLSILQCPVLIVYGKDGFIKVGNKKKSENGWIDYDLRIQKMRAIINEFPGGHHFHMNDDVSDLSECISKFISLRTCIQSHL